MQSCSLFLIPITRNWIHLIICFSTAAAIAGLFGVGDLLFHPSFCAPCNVYFKEITSVNGHLLLSKFSLSNYLQFTAKYTAVFTFTKIMTSTLLHFSPVDRHVFNSSDFVISCFSILKLLFVNVI